LSILSQELVLHGELADALVGLVQLLLGGVVDLAFLEPQFQAAQSPLTPGL
jgi:hypothetical protein